MALSPRRAGEAPDALLLRFPAEAARRRARSQAMLARRRRTIAAAVSLGALMAGGWSLGSGPEPASRVGAPASVVVRPGQSAWDIAERYSAAGTDHRVYVDALLRSNGLAGAVQAGERLRLPK